MTTYLSTWSWRFTYLTMISYLFTCSQLPTYLAIPSFIFILHFYKFVYMHFQATFYLLHHLTSLPKEHMHLQVSIVWSSSSLFLCFFKPLCKTLEQPKVSSLACPHVSHMSFKQHLKLPSRHPFIVGSIKGKLVVTFLCFFNLKCHCFVFVFFVASVVATPQSLSSSFFFSFLLI
jgi:hypothetical protein